MDHPSVNMIDLQSFSNPAEMRRLNKIQTLETIDKTELEFYKIRIFNISKEILQNKKVDQRLTELFYQFSNQCILYFKFIDKSDNIQDDYINLEENKEVVPFVDISNSHLIMMKEKTVKIPKITDHIKVKTTIIKKLFLPKERKINLLDPKYKMKGIKSNKKPKANKKESEVDKKAQESSKKIGSSKKAPESSKKKQESSKKAESSKTPEINKKIGSNKKAQLNKNTPNKKKKNKKKAKNKILNLYINDT